MAIILAIIIVALVVNNAFLGTNPGAFLLDIILVGILFMLFSC